MINYKEYVIKLDTMKEGLYKKINFKQTDQNTSKLVIHLKHNGVVLDVTGCDVRLALRKPDSTLVYQDCRVVDAESGIVEVILSTQSLAVPGIVEAELIVYIDEETVLTSTNFTINVKQSIMSDTSLESINEIPYIKKVVDFGAKLENIDLDLVGFLEDVQNVNRLANEVEEILRDETSIVNTLSSISEQMADTVLNVLTVSGVIAKSNGIDDNDTFKRWLTEYEKIYIPKGVSIKLGYSTAGLFITLTKQVEIYGGGTIEFIGDFTQTRLFRVSASNVVFKNITFTNNTRTYPEDVNSFIDLYESNNNKIIDCNFNHGIVYIRKGKGCEVSGCNFFDGSIVGRGGIDHHIHCNKFDKIEGTPTRSRTAIVVQSYVDNQSEGYLIENNWIYAAEWAGITLFKFNKDSVIKNNKIYMTETNLEAFGISLAFVDNCRCQDNLIINRVQPTTYAGIELVDSTGTELSGNKISGFRYGIISNGTLSGAFASNRNNHIENNTVKDFSESGIRILRSASGNVVRDNTFEMTFETGSRTVTGIYVDANGFENEFADNLVSGNKIYLTKTTSDGFRLRGIYINGKNTKCSENTVKIVAPDKTCGIMCHAPIKNSEIMTNNVAIEGVIDNKDCFGIHFGSINPTESLTNVIAKYNKVIAPSLLQANKIKVDAQGNSIIDENFIE